MALVIAALAFAGCAGSSAAAGKNCGTDATCLTNAAKACEQAYGTLASPAGTGTTMNMFAQIKGGTPSSCTYYFRIDSMTYSSSVSAQQKAAMDLMLKGKDMTCTMPQEMNMEDAMAANKCSGSLIDAMAAAYGGIGNSGSGDSGGSSDTDNIGGTGLPGY